MKIFQPASFNTADSGGTIGGGVLGGTPGSVLFVDSSSNLGQDNANFYFQDNATTPSALATNTNVALSINTAGDLTGSDTINVYAQLDAYLPNSLITNTLTGFNTDGAFPGYTASSSRGTGAVPVILNASDTAGGFSGWGYTGVSPSYQNLGGMMVFATGATAANLGGELRFYTKGDNGSLVQQLSISNTGSISAVGSIITSANMLATSSASGRIGVGVAAPSSSIDVRITTYSTGNQFSIGSNGGTGLGALSIASSTYTSTNAGGGTVATAALNTFGIPTLVNNTAATTLTNAASVYIAGAPVAGTGITITNPYALLVNSGNTLLNNGNLTLGTAGNKINIATGSNASVGTATLSGGTVTVSTTAVTANSKIFLTDSTTGALTNVGSQSVGTIVAGTSFVINSTNVLDASNVNWLIIN